MVQQFFYATMQTEEPTTIEDDVLTLLCHTMTQFSVWETGGLVWWCLLSWSSIRQELTSCIQRDLPHHLFSQDILINSRLIWAMCSHQWSHTQQQVEYTAKVKWHDFGESDRGAKECRQEPQACLGAGQRQSWKPLAVCCHFLILFLFFFHFLQPDLQEIIFPWSEPRANCYVVVQHPKTYSIQFNSILFI